MATEKRLVRPYAGLDDAREALEQWAFKIGEQEWPAGTSISIPRDQYLDMEPRIRFIGTDDDLAATTDELRTTIAALGLSGDDVDLVAVATTQRLKLHDVVHQSRLGAEVAIPLEIVFQRSQARALRTPVGGCTLELALCLARDVPPDLAHPLRPSRKGTWLAKTDIQIRTAADQSGFPVYPLTAEKRQELGLSEQTIRYVVLNGSPLEPTDPSDLEVYLDANLYSRISAQPREPGSRALQRELWVFAMTSIVLEAVRSSGMASAQMSDIEDSWLARLVEWVAGPRRTDQDAWLDLLRDQPAAFVSQIDVLAQRAADWSDIVP